MGHLIHRVTILGTGLIGGSFGLALHKDTTDICVSGWDRPEIVREAQSRAAIDKFFSGDIAPALQRSEEHTSELQSHSDLVCRLLLEKKNSASAIRRASRAVA